MTTRANLLEWVSVAALAATVACTADVSMPARADGSAVEANTVVRRLRVESGSFASSEVFWAGRFVAGVDSAEESNPGRPAILDLATGHTRVLSPMRGAEAVMASRDGRRMAVLWRIAGMPRRDKDPDDVGRFELRVIELGTGVMRTLFTLPVGYSAQLLDWSSDGVNILVTLLAPDHRNRLTLISSASGSAREILSLDRRRPDGEWGMGAAISPDSRWIAYDLPSSPGDVRQLRIVAADGSGDRQITDGAESRHLIGWSSDGAALFYATRRQSSTSVWRLTIREAHAAAAPVLMRGDLWGVTRFGRIIDDRIAFRVDLVKRSVGVLALDSTRTRALAPPSIVASGFDLTGPPAWSLDGTRLAITRRWGSSATTLVLRELATADERTLALDLDLASIGYWSNDGRSIIVQGERDAQRGTFRVDLVSGLTERAGAAAATPASARGIELVEHRAAGLTTLAVRNAATGTESVLFGPAHIGRPALAPDGSRVAIIEYTPAFARVLIVPTQGGVPLEVRRLPMPPGRAINPETQLLGVNSLSWSGNGMHLVFRATRHRAGQLRGTDQLWIATREGVATLLLERQVLGGTRLSGDGRRIAFATTVNEQPPELWAIEGLRLRAQPPGATLPP